MCQMFSVPGKAGRKGHCGRGANIYKGLTWGERQYNEFAGLWYSSLTGAWPGGRRYLKTELER